MAKNIVALFFRTRCRVFQNRFRKTWWTQRST